MTRIVKVIFEFTLSKGHKDVEEGDMNFCSLIFSVKYGLIIRGIPLMREWMHYNISNLLSQVIT